MRLLNLLLLLLLMPSSLLCGQEKVKLQIHFKGINNNLFNIHFDDGLVQDFIEVGQEDTLMLLERNTYTPYPRILIFHNGSYYKYLINRKNTVINIHYDSNRLNFPFYSDQSEDITPIYDTVSSPIFRKLRSDLKTENLQLTELWSKHGSEIRTNDSVKFVLRQLTEEMNSKTMEVLTSYPDDFFSFLYFKEQVLIPTLLVEDDSEYYNNLLAYYNRTFPSEFRLTVEGKQIVKDMEQKITPILIKEGEMMPDVYFKDLYGDTIFFKNQRERFVLLDFWASWCGPCLAQIPDIRLLRETFF
jgi:Redoxin.